MQTKPDTNKNIKIIKWLISLTPRKQVVAILLIAVATLFTPLATIFYNNQKTVNQCQIEKIEIIKGYTKQIEDIKDKQIEQLQKEKDRSQAIDSALRATDRIIHQKINQVK